MIEFGLTLLSLFYFTMFFVLIKNVCSFFIKTKLFFESKKTIIIIIIAAVFERFLCTGLCAKYFVISLTPYNNPVNR